MSSPVHQKGLESLFKPLIAVFYSPHLLLSGEGTLISECPVPDEDLEAMLNGFNQEKQEILFALKCQENSSLDVRYHRSLIDIVFDYARKEEKDAYIKGVHTTLLLSKLPPNTIAALYFNTKSELDEDIKAQEAEIDVLMTQFDDAMVIIPLAYLL